MYPAFLPSSYTLLRLCIALVHMHRPRRNCSEAVLCKTKPRSAACDANIVSSSMLHAGQDAGVMCSEVAACRWIAKSWWPVGESDDCYSGVAILIDVHYIPASFTHYISRSSSLSSCTTVCLIPCDRPFRPSVSLSSSSLPLRACCVGATLRNGSIASQRINSASTSVV